MGYKKTINISITIVLFIFSINLMPITTKADTPITIIPDSITSLTNLTGNVTAIQDNPNSPDANWLTAVNTNNQTIASGTFANNPVELTAGTNLQSVTFLVRKHAILGGLLQDDPTANLYVYENRNGTLHTIASLATGKIGDTPIVRSLSFNASSLVDKTGSNLEWKVVGHASSGLLGILLKTTVDIGAVNFNARLNIDPFGPPSNFRTTQITTNSINLQWNPVYQTNGYRIKRNGVVVYSGNQTTFSDTGLTDTTTYTYEVTAYNGTNYSPPSTITPKTLGTLSITVPSITNFPNVVFNSLTENVTTRFNSGLYIKNTTGNNMGWHITVEASQFQESGGLRLPKASLKLKPPITFIKLNGTTSNNPVATIDTPTVIDNGSAIKIINANPGNGEGEYQANFPDNSLELTIDLTTITANELNKTYQSTLSFTIVQGP